MTIERRAGERVTTPFGGGAAARARRASLSADTLRLDGSGMTKSSVLYFHGQGLFAGDAGVVFRDGVK